MPNSSEEDLLQFTSRPVNLHRTPSTKLAPAVYDRVDVIQAEIEEMQYKLNPRRKRDERSANCFRDCLRALCLDLFEAFTVDPEMLVGVKRDTSALTRNPAYPSFVSARPFINALDGLIQAGFVQQVHLGSEWSRKSTRVRGTKLLAEQLGIGELRISDLLDTSDPIILRVGPKKMRRRVAFSESADTTRWRENLTLINNHMVLYHAVLDTDDTNNSEIELLRLSKAKRHAEEDGAIINYQKLNFGQTRLHRVFNSRDWTEGGRFYGPWWQSVPKPFRKHIRINGKHTCEWDYSALHYGYFTTRWALLH